MATRFYLPYTGTPSISPSIDAGWETSHSLIRRNAVTTKISSTMTTIARTTDGSSANQDICFVQYISSPIAAQTISAQTLKFQMRQYEAATSANLFSAIGVRVLSGDGGTVRGTILAVSRDALELALTTLTNRQFTATTTEVVAQDGDVIVIEVGYGGDPSPASARHNGGISIGDDSATDLGENNTDTAAYNPWVEFANTLTFEAVNGLTSKDLFAAAATIDKPTLVQNAIIAKDITGGISTIEKPTITHAQFELVSKDVIAGVTTIENPTLGQEGEITYPLVFGEESPTEGTAIQWTTWSDGNAGTPDIIGGGWGKLGLGENEEGRSAVYDLGDATTRQFSLTANEYGSGFGDYDLEIRGSETSFGQDDSSPAWETYSSQISRAWRYVQIRATTATRMLSMWLQPEDMDTKTEIDAIITYASAHGVTDLFAAMVDWNTNPKTVLGNSTLGNATSKTADGKKPFVYLMEQAQANGIRVHAWVVVHFAYHWCGSSAVLLSPLTDNSTNHDTSNGGSCLNFATSSTRDTVTDFLEDMADENPGLASINLDYIRTDGLVTGIDLDDVTDFISELRAKTSVPISVCSLANKSAVTSHMQDAVSWIASNYIDMIVTMGYEYAYSVKWQYISGFNWSANPSKKLVWGLGAMTATENPSDLEFQFKKYTDQGYKKFSIFSWADDLKDNSDYDDVLDDLKAGTLNPTMGDVTKVTVTPATSIALTIGGTIYTTTYSSVSSYTTQGTLKGYIESVQGARPFIYYMRKTTSTIQIMIGEFEP